MTSWSQDHIRKTFLTGIFAFLPLAVTAFIIWWIDDKTRGVLLYLFGWKVHFIGVLIGIGLIYVTGLVANSLIGRFILRGVDALLLRLPVVRQVYNGWKQVALTPGGTEGTFSKVVLIPDETNFMKLIGFTSGRPIEADEPCYCVFVPGAPNPITGRLYLVPIERCTLIDMSVEEAFKMIVSTGNYVPPLTPLVAVSEIAAPSSLIASPAARD